MDREELVDRARNFALRCWKLADALPRTPSGRNAADQLARSGSAVVANYRAALRGRSRAEWAARLGVVVEEADEALLWIELIGAAGLLPAGRLDPLRREAEELLRIFSAARRSSKS
jgi:four helix bundle protein